MNVSTNTNIPFKEILVACLKKYKSLVIIGCLIIATFSTFIGLLWGSSDVSSSDGGVLNSPIRIVVLTVFLSFFVGLGFLILYGFLFNLVLFTSRLLNSGIHTQGKITKIEKNFDNVLHYEFKDKTGKLYQGVSGKLTDDIASQWAVGQSGAICYDPLKPKKNLWYADDWKKYLL